MTIDHCGKRNGHQKLSYEELEDELDYNYGRKLELKKEVKIMQDKYDDLYEVYMKNTKAAMDRNVENASLKAEIEKKHMENIELQLENEKFIERVDSLEKDNAKLKDMECENRYLGDVVKFKEDNEDKNFNELKESNKNPWA